MQIDYCPLERLLMTVDPVGGVWTYALDLSRELARRGVQIDLASMGAAVRPEQRAEVRAIPGVRLFESGLRLEWMDDCWPDVARAGQWLLQLERECKPQLIHLNGYVHAALPWSAPVVVVAHSCVFSWWKAVKHDQPPASWNFYRWRVQEGLRAANLVIAPTAAMLRQTELFYGKVSRKQVIPHGREATLFYPQPKSELILTAGRLWDDAKNVSTLASIAADLDWPVYVAGEAHPPGGGAAASLGGLRALGFVPPVELASWMRSAAIFALPARYEPFGLTALEAALCGCALVLGDIPSLRETWDGAAIFVRPDDHRALRSALQHLAGHPDFRSDLAARARARAIGKSPARMAEQHLAAYQGMIENAAADRRRLEFLEINPLAAAGEGAHQGGF